MWRKNWYISFIVVLFLLILFVLLFIINIGSDRMIEQRLKKAIDEKCPNIGLCLIDMDAVFNDFDWDTCSIFCAGNSSVIKQDLGIDNDISDGILFSLKGKPIIYYLSTYSFPDDEPADITFYIENLDLYQKPYISFKKGNCLVQAEKYYLGNKRTAKYVIFAKDSGTVPSIRGH